MMPKRNPLPPATVARLNAILRACAERLERRNAELTAQQHASQVIAAAVERVAE